MNKVLEHYLYKLKDQVWKRNCVESIQSRGFKIVSIKDTTPMLHNGARPPKKRRV